MMEKIFETKVPMLVLPKTKEEKKRFYPWKRKHPHLVERINFQDMGHFDEDGYAYDELSEREYRYNYSHGDKCEHCNEFLKLWNMNKRMYYKIVPRSLKKSTDFFTFNR